MDKNLLISPVQTSGQYRYGALQAASARRYCRTRCARRRRCGLHVALPAFEAGLHRQIGLGMSLEREASNRSRQTAYCRARVIIEGHPP